MPFTVHSDAFRPNERIPVRYTADGGNTSDPAARKKAYSAAIKLMTEKAYWLPLFTYVNTYAFSKQLQFKTFPDELPRFYFAKWQ